MRGILDSLGHRHGTDKASGGHDYLHFYERFLAPLRDQRIVLLEIGVGYGSSLYMWQDYFLRAKVVGMDNNPDLKQFAKDRVEIEIGDQARTEDVLRIAEKYGPFDVVVDDAGHDPAHQVSCCNLLLPHVKQFYILEDIGGEECTNHLIDLSKKVMQDRSNRIESIAFYNGTSIIKIKDTQ